MSTKCSFCGKTVNKPFNYLVNIAVDYSEGCVKLFHAKVKLPKSKSCCKNCFYKHIKKWFTEIECWQETHHG